MKSLADYETREVAWLWPGYIPLGKFTILAGDPGVGKGALLADIVARVTTGATWPDGSPGGTPGHVLWLQAEDGIEDTIKPRVLRHGGDVVRVDILVGAPRVDCTTDAFSLQSDLGALEAELWADPGKYKLVVIDPVNSYLSRPADKHHRPDSRVDSDMKVLLKPLIDVAGRTGVAVVGVFHPNKNEMQRAVYRVGGSVGIIGTARVALGVAADPEDPGDGAVVGVFKTNLVKSATLRVLLGSDPTKPIRWLGPSRLSIVQILEADGKRGAPRPPGSKGAAAIEFLRELLAGGPVPADEVQRQARTREIKEITLDRAKRTLEVRSESRHGGGYVWRLPSLAEADPWAGRGDDKDPPSNHDDDEEITSSKGVVK